MIDQDNDIDGQTVMAVEHIMITDTDTKDVLVNQRGSQTGQIVPVEIEDNEDISSR